MRPFQRGNAAKVAMAAVVVLSLAACASNEASGSEQGSKETASTPAGQPDVNGDGKVVIGILSPGDINDGGYFQSFVDGAETFSKPKGWTVIARGNVSTADALSAARALCAQKVDMIALGAGSLADAIPASEEPACKNTVWYVPAQGNIAQTPRILLSEDSVNQNLLAAGYAAGLLMQDKQLNQAGFVGGLDVEFERRAAAAFKSGVRSVLPDANVLTSFAGDQNDSAKAKEATQAQLRQGAKVIYPYLGGSTDAAARLANQAGALTLTPGTNRCASTDPTFDISVIFDPGSYLTAALAQFADGKLEIGTKKTWKMGVDAVPTVKFCNGTDEQNQKLDQFIQDIGSGKINADDEVKRLGS
ncbi:BMP family lipoprotein [Rhodococcus sp. ACPA4]|uniref:BMP family lipoprotein n=1 Tax=Rhodococcus sp. ACPA4 TaxID=2028571 RepID=UPI001C528F03|nr:BMP family ABC transporter substrate-binding protein [Rhodococcus sp. ACPA4]